MVSSSPTVLNIFIYADKLSNLYLQSRLCSQIRTHISNCQLWSLLWHLTETSDFQFSHPNLPHLHNHHFSWNSIFQLLRLKALILSLTLPFPLHPTIPSVRKSCWVHLQKTSRIWPPLPMSTANTQVWLTIISCLVWYNSLLKGLFASNHVPPLLPQLGCLSTHQSRLIHLKYKIDQVTLLLQLLQWQFHTM